MRKPLIFILQVAAILMLPLMVGTSLLSSDMPSFVPTSTAEMFGPWSLEENEVQEVKKTLMPKVVIEEPLVVEG